MKVNIEGFDYECRAAVRKRNSIVLYLGKYDKDGNEYTSTFINTGIAEAFVIGGTWEYDALTEPSQADRIEAQVTYTAMMTDTLLEV